VLELNIILPDDPQGATPDPAAKKPATLSA
jgi:hypothetical protein